MSVEFPNGPVPLDSSFYIQRPPVEELVYAELLKPGSVTRIKAPRKMGKSSLLLRMLARATTEGYRAVTLDFQQADETIFSSLNKFLRWFCANIARQLNLKPLLDDYWDEDMGSKVSCTIYLEGYLLEQINSPLVLALNEVNLLFEHPKIAREFLPLLRFWHEQAKQVEILQKLRLIVVHSTEIYVSLNINQSPFNVGLPIKLKPFTWEQVQELARRHQLNWTTGNQAQQLMAMVGGHPYLVRLALYYLSVREITLEKLLREAPTEAGIYRDHLRGHWGMLQKQPELATAIKEVVTAKQNVQLKSLVAYKLDSLGLIFLEEGECTPSCPLYRQYFAEQLSQQILSGLPTESNLAVIIFTDVTNSTQKMAVNQKQMLQLLKRDYQIMQDICQHYGGKVLKSMGDGLLMYFVSAVKAIACAQEIQKKFAKNAASLPPDEVLTHRLGVHLGDVFFSGNDVLGIGVNIAARLQSKAKPGGICISQTVYEVVKDRISLQVLDMGEQQLRGIPQPMRLYQLSVNS